ncbi:e7cae451-74ba-45df-92b4-c008e8a2ec21 [Thermothielavioides terrestris]|uniref:E7cae451-74ba-45df-92b4-c008e8a2ec21 n=1 Tax=Thermothielavioides terrestris TaxID=2587410 RepID=A0A3S5CXJ0_9PEZI|nr:e7cae451-74ba-45df-92b4-c008e8a2ec21 [Thermothielavioides terrestris]
MASPSASSPLAGSPAPGSSSLDRRRVSDSNSNSGSSTPRPFDGADPASPLPQILWRLQVPLYITHMSQPATTPPFIVSVPRFSYLAFLLPRLTAYYGLPCSSFHHEEIQLRNLPVGLLVDLYQPPSLPWHLVVGDGPEWDIADTFTNSAKEADFVRNGNAKQIMSLSKEHSTSLWNAVRDNDFATFSKINNRLLNTPTPLKNVPMRLYIPSSPNDPNDATPGSFRVVQTLVPARLPSS